MRCKMKKSTLGFILGFFFGILGLLGLLACSEEEKSEFMSGWIKAFVVSIILTVILVIIVMCSVGAMASSY